MKTLNYENERKTLLEKIIYIILFILNIWRPNTIYIYIYWSRAMCTRPNFTRIPTVFLPLVIFLLWRFYCCFPQKYLISINESFEVNKIEKIKRLIREYWYSIAPQQFAVAVNLSPYWTTVLNGRGTSNPRRENVCTTTIARLKLMIDNWIRDSSNWIMIRLYNLKQQEPPCYVHKIWLYYYYIAMRHVTDAKMCCANIHLRVLTPLDTRE